MLHQVYGRQRVSGGYVWPRLLDIVPGAAHKKGPRQSWGQSSGVSRPPPGPVCGGRPPGLGWYDGPRAGYIGGGRLFLAYHKQLHVLDVIVIEEPPVNEILTKYRQFCPANFQCSKR